jgi:hypothetical protein
VPNWVDGRSFAPQLHNPAVDAHPRQSYLVEHWNSAQTEHIGSGPTEPHDLDVKPGTVITAAPGLQPQGRGFAPEFHGVRTVRYLYVEYNSGARVGARELYDTRTDPYELYNLAYKPAEAPLVARLHQLVARLKDCDAAECRQLEDAPIRA